MTSWRMGSLPFQNDTDTDNKAALSSFAKVKRDLDPAFSYIIFEKPMKSGNIGDFSGIVEFLSSLQGWTLKRELYCDESAKKILLVVQMEQKQVDGILQRFFGFGLPKKISLYIYNSQPRDGDWKNGLVKNTNERGCNQAPWAQTGLQNAFQSEMGNI